MLTQRKSVFLLPPSVAERIAAGEVIERPGSVVKELVENSLDAGATEIIVALEDGGKALIEVTDNGHGMTREDLALSVQRHATSKLRTLGDLESLSSLGFRGEALPSVGAVAELSILSRTEDALGSNEIILGDIGTKPEVRSATFGHFLGKPHGTRVRARGLFAQVPARFKFLKSKSAEVSYVREWLERIALSHPEVGFRLVSDDRTVLSLKADSEAGRVKAVLSDGQDFPVITATDESGPCRITIQWLQGMGLPTTRKLIQVVNGRAVRDRVLQQALLGGFRQSLLPGQFPALLLKLEIDPSRLDVNVHPSKTELRFLDQSAIYRALQGTLERMIAANGTPAFVASREFPTESPSFGVWEKRLFTPAHHYAQSSELSLPQVQPTWSFTNPPVAESPSTSPTSNECYTLPSQTHPLSNGRFVGMIFNTYLVYDLGHELALVDQHAADERVRYERLRKRFLSEEHARVATQALLLPEAVRFPNEARQIVEERLLWLAKLGFEAELFGESTLLFRSLPGEWGLDSLALRLKGLTERLIDADLQEASLGVDESVFEKLASEACHSSVRAGDRLETLEALALVGSLFQCAHPWNCPHGRPTVVRVPQGRLEEWFQRRV
jgi:DNA mismatch repair protein MutL